MTRRCFNCAPESCICDEPSSRPVGETNDQRYHRLVWEHDAAFRRWIQTLAHNLAIAAALCGAFRDGWDQSRGLEDWWKPGCGREAP